jgi:hypothetical protein
MFIPSIYPLESEKTHYWDRADNYTSDTDLLFRGGAFARQRATPSRIAAIAVGRGKLRRYASAIRRDGAGCVNGTGTTSWL